jgi:predicted NBD/HSP70 family sugar kinase/biotin operon repressor
MNRTADQTVMKEMNKLAVLNEIRFQSPISRTQISDTIGLTKATVSAMIEELIDDGLVIEVGQGQSRVGRRPIMLSFNAKAATVIGVDLGVEYVRVVATDLALHILATYSCELPQNVGLMEIIEIVVGAVHEIDRQVMKKSLKGTIGIGIGVPGLVDYERGIVLRAPHLHWDNIPIRSILQSRLNKFICVDNEANAGAMAEKFYGQGKYASSLLYVSAGTGIGTGIVMGDELVRGADGMAGEFGHMSVDRYGDVCSCGNIGCWELYASEQALINTYQKLTGRSETFTEVLHDYRNEDAAAIQAFDTVGRSLGLGVASLTNGLNPSMVVIGNRLAEAGDRMIDVIQRSILEHSFISPFSKATVQLSSFGSNACAVGSATLVLHEYFAGLVGHV